MTRSYWIESQRLPRFPRPDRALDVDVVVVGAGITGITTAYVCRQAGARVVLLERARCASVDTGHTTAHLTAVPDLRLQELTKQWGRAQARAVWDGGVAAIDLIHRLVQQEEIACDFRWVTGYLHAPATVTGAPLERHIATLRGEARAARALGINADYEEHIPGFEKPGVRFPGQAIFHPRKYLAGLLARIPGNGSHVFEGTAAEAFHDSPLAVDAGGHRLRCRFLVLATHTPLTGTTGVLPALLFQTKLALYTSYVLAARVPRGVIPTASFWDTADPYHYLRCEPRGNHDLAIYGGEDHKTGQRRDTTGQFARLERHFRRLMPAGMITHRWSGQVIETNDGLPYIGETAERQFAATGFAGNGMTFGTLSAIMALDALQGRGNPWHALFDPKRRKLRGGVLDYLRENKDYPFFLLRDWLGGSEGRSLRALRRGQGKILQLDGRKVAAYRDEEGRLILRSPVCTHLQCIVAWNPAERTWDCPCHGSRFQPTGEVIAGPAEAPLEEVKLPGGEE